MLEEQIELQTGLANLEISIDESRDSIVEIYRLALQQGLEDNTGIMKIAIDSFTRLMTKFTELCKNYGRLEKEIENI